jgi:hypothetical protein
VGIGTSSPDVSLEVNGGIRARGGAPGGGGVNNNGYAFEGNGGDTDGGMFSSADGQIEFYTNSTEKFRINPSGQQSSVVPGGVTLYNEFKCRAWVNFDGRGGTSIRASGNVSSVTRTDTGRYEVNFSTAMPDASYATVCGVNKYDNNDDANAHITTGANNLFQTASKAYITTAVGTASTRYDSGQVSVAIFR